MVAEGLTRTEVTELVQAVKARRPPPTRRPDPVTVDLGDCSVTVRWKKASETTVLQALRKAAKQVQDRETPRTGGVSRRGSIRQSRAGGDRCDREIRISGHQDAIGAFRSVAAPSPIPALYGRFLATIDLPGKVDGIGRPALTGETWP